MDDGTSPDEETVMDGDDMNPDDTISRHGPGVCWNHGSPYPYRLGLCDPGDPYPFCPGHHDGSLDHLDPDHPSDFDASDGHAQATKETENDADANDGANDDANLHHSDGVYDDALDHAHSPAPVLSHYHCHHHHHHHHSSPSSPTP